MRYPPRPDMDHKPNGQPHATNPTAAGEPRKTKTVRVTLDSSTPVPTREREQSPAALGHHHHHHHRSLTHIDVQKPSISAVTPNGNPSSEDKPAEEANAAPARSSASGRPTALQRARSDYGPRVGRDQPVQAEEDDVAMRHGWQEEYTSSEYLKLLHSVGFQRNLLGVWRAQLIAVRISTCTSQKSAMRRPASPGIRTAAGPSRTGACEIVSRPFRQRLRSV